MISIKKFETVDEFGERCWLLPDGRKTYYYEEAITFVREYNYNLRLC